MSKNCNLLKDRASLIRLGKIKLIQYRKEKREHQLKNNITPNFKIENKIFSLIKKLNLFELENKSLKKYKNNIKEIDYINTTTLNNIKKINKQTENINYLITRTIKNNNENDLYNKELQDIKNQIIILRELISNNIILNSEIIEKYKIKKKEIIEEKRILTENLENVIGQLTKTSLQQKIELEERDNQIDRLNDQIRYLEKQMNLNDK